MAPPVKPPVKIEYAHTIGPYKLFRRPVQRRGGVLNLLPGQSQDGYGEKITMDICLKFNDEKQERRVYCTCFSNAGSCWIIYNKRKVHLLGHDSSEVIEDEKS